MALRTPAFNDAKTYGFEWLRLLQEAVVQEGVVGAGDFKVTAAAAGAPLRVDVAAGIAQVKGDSGTPGTGLSHGLYLVVNDAAIANSPALVAAHATLPRIDQIVLRVRDTADLGSAGDDALLEVVTGTATGGATLDNRTGAAALPNDALRLADVLVPAAATAVVAGNVRDRRPWARGAYRRMLKANSNAATTSNTSVPIDTTLLSARVECSGVPLAMSLTGAFGHTVTSSRIHFLFTIDGAQPDANIFPNGAPAGAGDLTTINAEYVAIPTPGSRLVMPQYKVDSGTGTVQANAGYPVVLTIAELVQQNADNT